MLALAGTTAAELAARLTLLALRASVAAATPLAPDRVILAPATAAVATDSAVRTLVAMPKPLLCSATAPSGTLVVTCTPLADAESSERETFRITRADAAERGGYMGYLEEEHGSRDHLVAAFGRPGESLTLPRSAVDHWHDEYDLRGVSIVGDDADNPLAEDAVYADARRLGAAGLLRFGSPADDKGEMHAEVMILSDTASDADRQRALPMLIEMAQMFTRMLGMPPDSLPPHDPARPKTAYRLWQEKTLRQQQEQVKTWADRMEAYFKGRPMPPEIAAFIAACRERCTP